MKKRRVLSAAARANISLGLARALGPTRGLDPTTYEKKGRKKGKGKKVRTATGAIRSTADVPTPKKKSAKVKPTPKRDLDTPTVDAPTTPRASRTTKPVPKSTQAARSTRPVPKSRADKDGWGAKNRPAPELTPQQKKRAAQNKRNTDEMLTTAQKANNKAIDKQTKANRKGLEKQVKAEQRADKKAASNAKKQAARAELRDAHDAAIDGVKAAATSLARDIAHQNQIKRDRKRYRQGAIKNPITNAQRLRAEMDKQGGDSTRADALDRQRKQRPGKETTGTAELPETTIERAKKQRRTKSDQAKASNLNESGRRNVSQDRERHPGEDNYPADRPAPRVERPAPQGVDLDEELDAPANKRDVIDLDTTATVGDVQDLANLDAEVTAAARDMNDADLAAARQRVAEKDQDFITRQIIESLDAETTRRGGTPTPDSRDVEPTPTDVQPNRPKRERPRVTVTEDPAPEVPPADLAPGRSDRPTDTPDTTVQGGGHQASADYLDPDAIRQEKKYRADLNELARKLDTPEKIDRFRAQIDRARTTADTDTGNPRTNRQNLRRATRMDAMAADLNINDGQREVTRPEDADTHAPENYTKTVDGQRPIHRTTAAEANHGDDSPQAKRARAQHGDPGDDAVNPADRDLPTATPESQAEDRKAGRRARQAARSDINRNRANRKPDTTPEPDTTEQDTPPSPADLAAKAQGTRGDNQGRKERQTARGRTAQARQNKRDETTRRRADEQRTNNLRQSQAADRAASDDDTPEDIAPDAYESMYDAEYGTRADDLANEAADRDAARAQFVDWSDDNLADEAAAIRDRWDNDLTDWTPEGTTDEVNLDRMRRDRTRLAAIDTELDTRRADNPDRNNTPDVDDEQFASLTDADAPTPAEDPDAHAEANRTALMRDMDDDDLAELSEGGPLADAARAELARRNTDRADNDTARRAPRKGSNTDVRNTADDNVDRDAALALLEADDKQHRDTQLALDLRDKSDADVQQLATHGNTDAQAIANAELDRRDPYREGGALQQRAAKFSSRNAFDNYVRKNNLTDAQAKKLADLGAAAGNQNLDTRTSYADEYDGYITGIQSRRPELDYIGSVDHNDWDTLRGMVDISEGKAKGRDRTGGEAEELRKSEELLTAMFDEVGHVPSLRNFIRTSTGQSPEGPTSVDDIREHFAEKSRQLSTNARGKRGPRLTPAQKQTKARAQGYQSATDAGDLTDKKLQARIRDMQDPGKPQRFTDEDKNAGRLRAHQDEAMRRGILDKDDDYKARFPEETPAPKKEEPKAEAPKATPAEPKNSGVTATANKINSTRAHYEKARGDKSLTPAQKAQAELEWRTAERDHVDALIKEQARQPQSPARDKRVAELSTRLADKQRRLDLAQARLDKANTPATPKKTETKKTPETPAKSTPKKPKAETRKAKDTEYSRATGADRDLLIYDAIKDEAYSTDEVAAMTGLTPAQARASLNRLADRGLLGKSAEGGVDGDLTGGRRKVSENIAWSDNFRDNPDGRDALIADHKAGKKKTDAPKETPKKPANPKEKATAYAATVERPESWKADADDIARLLGSNGKWRQRGLDRIAKDPDRYGADEAEFKARRTAINRKVKENKAAETAAREEAYKSALDNGLPDDVSKQQLSELANAARDTMRHLPEGSDKYNAALALSNAVDERRKSINRAEAAERKARTTQNNVTRNLATYLREDKGKREFAAAIDDGTDPVQALQSIAARFGVQIDDNDDTRASADRVTGTIRGENSTVTATRNAIDELVRSNNAGGKITPENLEVANRVVSGKADPRDVTEPPRVTSRDMQTPETARNYINATSGLQKPANNGDIAWRNGDVNVTDAELDAAITEAKRRDASHRANPTRPDNAIDRARYEENARAYSQRIALERERDFRNKPRPDNVNLTYDQDGNADLYAATPADANNLIGGNLDAYIPENSGDKITARIGDKTVTIERSDAPGRFRITGPDGSTTDVAPDKVPDHITSTVDASGYTPGIDTTQRRSTIANNHLGPIQRGAFTPERAEAATEALATVAAEIPANRDTILAELNKLRKKAGLPEIDRFPGEGDGPGGTPATPKTTDTPDAPTGGNRIPITGPNRQIPGKKATATPGKPRSRFAEAPKGISLDYADRPDYTPRKGETKRDNDGLYQDKNGILWADQRGFNTGIFDEDTPSFLYQDNDGPDLYIDKVVTRHKNGSVVVSGTTPDGDRREVKFTKSDSIRGRFEFGSSVHGRGGQTPAQYHAERDADAKYGPMYGKGRFDRENRVDQVKREMAAKHITANPDSDTAPTFTDEQAEQYAAAEVERLVQETGAGRQFLPATLRPDGDYPTAAGDLGKRSYYQDTTGTVWHHDPTAQRVRVDYLNNQIDDASTGLLTDPDTRIIGPDGHLMNVTGVRQLKDSIKVTGTTADGKKVTRKFTAGTAPEVFRPLRHSDGTPVSPGTAKEILATENRREVARSIPHDGHVIQLGRAKIDRDATRDRANIITDANGSRHIAPAPKFDMSTMNGTSGLQATAPKSKHLLASKPGEPITSKYMRNPQSLATNQAPGMDFGQDVEPAGRYMTFYTPGAANVPDDWESGEITFNNPLHLDVDLNNAFQWKRDLSAHYGGKTGAALSQAVRNDGHDGIITNDKYGTGEVVDLTHLTAQKNYDPDTGWTRQGTDALADRLLTDEGRKKFLDRYEREKDGELDADTAAMFALAHVASDIIDVDWPNASEYAGLLTAAQVKRIKSPAGMRRAIARALLRE